MSVVSLVVAIVTSTQVVLSASQRTIDNTEREMGFVKSQTIFGTYPKDTVSPPPHYLDIMCLCGTFSREGGQHAMVRILGVEWWRRGGDEGDKLLHFSTDSSGKTLLWLRTQLAQVLFPSGLSSGSGRHSC